MPWIGVNTPRGTGPNRRTERLGLRALQWFVFCILDANIAPLFRQEFDSEKQYNGVNVIVLENADMLAVADFISSLGIRTGLINPSDVAAHRGPFARRDDPFSSPPVFRAPKDPGPGPEAAHNDHICECEVFCGR